MVIFVLNFFGIVVISQFALIFQIFVESGDDILREFHQLLKSGSTFCDADIDKKDGSFQGHDVDNVRKGFDRDELKYRTKGHGFSDIKFKTAYHMEREINEVGTTKIVPTFLMTAQKE